MNEFAEGGGENDEGVEIFRAPSAAVDASGEGDVNRGGRDVVGGECVARDVWKSLLPSGGAVGIVCVITCGANGLEETCGDLNAYPPVVLSWFVIVCRR